MDNRDVWRERHLLENARRDKIKELMVEYDKEHYAKVKELMDYCGTIGHEFKHTGFGPTGWIWYHCNLCGKSKSVDPDANNPE